GVQVSARPAGEGEAGQDSVRDHAGLSERHPVQAGFPERPGRVPRTVITLKRGVSYTAARPTSKPLANSSHTFRARCTMPRPLLALGAALLVFAQGALAHHSYAMFDHTKTVTIEGSVAKLEWVNPHVFVWVYVKNANTGAYDLYGFENGPVTMMMRAGWNSE